MKFKLILILITANIMSYSQSNNLVLNPSFEDDSLCPDGDGVIDQNYVRFWNTPNWSSTDYFHTCGYCSSCGEQWYMASVPRNILGYEIPKTGLAYTGFYLYLKALSLSNGTREYIQGQLKDSLVNNQKYIVRFYVSVAEDYEYDNEACVDNIGAYFSDTMMYSSTYSKHIPIVPQIQNLSGNVLNNFNGWQKIEGTFIATGGEKFISIGNFQDNAHTNVYDCRGIGIPTDETGSYVYLDDVSVIDTSTTDTISLCKNDSILLGGAWRQQKDSGIIFIDTVLGLFVRSYIQPSLYSAYRTDTILYFQENDSVKAGYVWMYTDSTLILHYSTPNHCDSVVYYHCMKELGIDQLPQDVGYFSLFPNPSHDFIEIKLANNSSPTYQISIFDITGKEIISQSSQQNKIDVTTLNSGMYFVKLMNAKSTEVLGVKKFVKE